MLLESKNGSWGFNLAHEYGEMNFEFIKNKYGDYVCDVPESIPIISELTGKVVRTVQKYAQHILKSYPDNVRVYQKKKGRPKQEDKQ